MCEVKLGAVDGMPIHQIQALNPTMMLYGNGDFWTWVDNGSGGIRNDIGI